MNENKKKDEPSLVEKHALNRLNKVETDRRKAYSKKDDGPSWQTIIVIIIFVAILVVLLFSMKF